MPVSHRQGNRSLLLSSPDEKDVAMEIGDCITALPHAVVFFFFPAVEHLPCGFFLKQMHQKKPKPAGNHEVQPPAMSGDNEVTLRPAQHSARAHRPSCSLPPPRMEKPQALSFLHPSLLCPSVSQGSNHSQFQLGPPGQPQARCSSVPRSLMARCVVLHTEMLSALNPSSSTTMDMPSTPTERVHPS